MRLMYVRGGETIFADVKRLGPGEQLRYRLAGRDVQVARWWRPAAHPCHETPAEEWPERLRSGLRAAVGRWTLADVPVACSLSGGLDSSAIVGALAEAGASVRTVSLRFTAARHTPW